MSEEEIDSDRLEAQIESLGSLKESNTALSRDSEPESLLARLRLQFWPQHEPLIAGLLFVCILGMSAYFIQRSVIHNGLVDIERAESLNAEFRVDINQAELGEIVLLPGVGEKLAQAILDHRIEQGEFESLASLQDVPGIGQSKFDSLIPYLLPIQSQ